jgi:hypothetical protein
MNHIWIALYLMLLIFSGSTWAWKSRADRLKLTVKFFKNYGKKQSGLDLSLPIDKVVNTTLEADNLSDDELSGIVRAILDNDNIEDLSDFSKFS